MVSTKIHEFPWGILPRPVAGVPQQAEGMTAPQCTIDRPFFFAEGDNFDVRFPAPIFERPNPEISVRRRFELNVDAGCYCLRGHRLLCGALSSSD